jgi:hypothetical protein
MADTCCCYCYCCLLLLQLLLTLYLRSWEPTGSATCCNTSKTSGEFGSDCDSLLCNDLARRAPGLLGVTTPGAAGLSKTIDKFQQYMSNVMSSLVRHALP